MKKETLELRLKELDSTINTYKEIFFLGAKKSDTWGATYEYLPPGVDYAQGGVIVENPIALFNFSEAGGICGGGVIASQGIKVNPDFQIKTKCTDYQTVLLSVERLKDRQGIVEDGFAGVVRNAEFPDGYGTPVDRERGFYYRIPLRTQFRVSVGLDSIPRMRSNARLCQSHNSG